MTGFIGAMAYVVLTFKLRAGEYEETNNFRVASCVRTSTDSDVKFHRCLQKLPQFS